MVRDGLSGVNASQRMRYTSPMTTERQFLHAGRTLTYALRRSARARNVSVTVGRDGSITLVLPERMPEWLGVRFLKERADWALRTAASMERFRDHVVLPRDRRDYARHKERARRFVHACLARHAPSYGLSYRRVFIKNLRRNWGSCSAEKNLNFNYKIIHLPERHAEYVVVHELCHLAELNHSRRFWSLVAKAIPEHRRIRKEMRNYVP
jgi:hypothetical protein